MGRMMTGALPVFLSTPSARRATAWPSFSGHVGGISIHALREEGDITARNITSHVYDISIHALREEGDKRWAGKS